MDCIRVCIGSNDGETLARTHMGDTTDFHIYDIFADSTSVFVEKRVNRARDMDHAGTGKMQEILLLVSDVDMLVGQQKSPNFINIAAKTKYQPVVVDAETISDVLAILSRSFASLFGYVDRRRSGEFCETIPEL